MGADKRKGRWRAVFSRPSTRFGAGFLVVIGLVAGIAATAGFASFVKYSNSKDFCRSCHEMEAFVFPEWEQSHHHGNPSGVQAICSDCHVPRAFLPKMATKIRASFNEIPKHLMGKMDTREEFEALKPELAERVWNRMKRTDSRECRACHNADAMVLADQALRAQREHEAARESGETCIDCHKGVAHSLPAGFEEADEEEELDFDF